MKSGAHSDFRDTKHFMNRRTFMTTAMALAVTASRRGWTAEPHRIEKVGIQLYTVRDLLNQDFDGIMSGIAAIGYKEVELGFYTDRPAKEVRATLDRLSLTSPSCAFYYSDLRDHWPRIMERCHTIGHRYIVIPSVDKEFREQPDGYKRAAEAFSRAGEIAAKAEIQMTYHNHWSEFVPDAKGKLPYDILLENSDPKLLKMEMDLCWITVGGGDPLEYFARYPGRFPLVHVKDLKSVPDRALVRSGKFDGDSVIPVMTEAGSGVIDWKRIFAHSEQAGIKHYFVEHDQPKKPMESARLSYEYLSRVRF
jgi:sugar phosphate isomerase/epimerase